MHPLIAALTTGLAYMFAAWVGATYTITDFGMAVLWPANAVVLSAFLLLPKKQWPLIALVCISAELFVSSASFPIWAAASFGLINMFEAALAAFLILRWSQTPFAFDRVNNAASFLLFGPILASALAGLLGALVYLMLDPARGTYLSLWRLWWLGDALGLLLLTPLLIGLVDLFRNGIPEINRPRSAEFVILCLLLVFVGPRFFIQNDISLLEFHFTPILMLPFGIWAAVRLGVIGTVVTVVVIAALAVNSLMNGTYPYATASPEYAVWLTQEFLATVAIVSVGLAVLLAEIRQNNLLLEQRIEERTESLRTVNEALNAANDRLQQQASLDFLTGITNRRYFYENAERVLVRSRQEKSVVSIIMFDLDHFKNINDEQGHEAGDVVLKSVTLPVINALRPLDLFSRTGGEEFLVLLPSLTVEDAMMIAERIRLAIATTTINIADMLPITVTVSSGVAQWNGKESLQRLVSRVDQAMYEAKDAGRNCVRVAINP